MDFTTLICILILISIGLLIFGIYKLIKTLNEKERRGKLICKKCKQVYDEDDIFYEETNKGTSTKTDNNGNVTRSVWSTVKFTCTCHNCKTEKIFKRAFTIYKGDSSGHAKTFDLDESIDKFLDLSFKKEYDKKQLKKHEKEIQKVNKKSSEKIEVKPQVNEADIDGKTESQETEQKNNINNNNNNNK